jgi:hypothetical protein
VIACTALFISLGGTGIAATQIHPGATDAKAKSKTKEPSPLTAKQVEKLIAAYATKHHLGATGPQGARGAQGAEGKTGPEGPGAQQILDEQVAPDSGSLIATAGLWRFVLICTSSQTEVQIFGPGSFSYTESFGTFNGTASTASNTVTVNGFTSTIGNGHQQGIQGFLNSGSTTEQIDLEITADNGACDVTGDAIPVS